MVLFETFGRERYAQSMCIVGAVKIVQDVSSKQLVPDAMEP